MERIGGPHCRDSSDRGSEAQAKAFFVAPFPHRLANFQYPPNGFLEFFLLAKIVDPALEHNALNVRERKYGLTMRVGYSP